MRALCRWRQPARYWAQRHP